MPYFRGDEGAELGDQGRFPPVLTAVGRKLRPAVLADAVAGHEKVRPYLMTRMPRMGRENLDGLPRALMAATRRLPPIRTSRSSVRRARRRRGAVSPATAAASAASSATTFAARRASAYGPWTWGR